MRRPLHPVEVALFTFPCFVIVFVSRLSDSCHVRNVTSINDTELTCRVWIVCGDVGFLARPSLCLNFWHEAYKKVERCFCPSGVWLTFAKMAETDPVRLEILSLRVVPNDSQKFSWNSTKICFNLQQQHSLTATMTAIAMRCPTWEWRMRRLWNLKITVSATWTTATWSASGGATSQRSRWTTWRTGCTSTASTLTRPRTRSWFYPVTPAWRTFRFVTGLSTHVDGSCPTWFARRAKIRLASKSPAEGERSTRRNSRKSSQRREKLRQRIMWVGRRNVRRCEVCSISSFRWTTQKPSWWTSTSIQTWSPSKASLITRRPTARW